MSERRFAGIAVPHELFRYILKLPEGANVIRIEDNFDTMSLRFLLEATKGTRSWELFDEHEPGELIEIRYVECADDRIIAVTFKWWAILAARDRWGKIKKWFKKTLDKG